MGDTPDINIKLVQSKAEPGKGFSKITEYRILLQSAQFSVL